jgi:hypothetical protein
MKIEKYRKLTKKELLNTYGVDIEKTINKYRAFREFAKAYYPKTAATMKLIIQSEYNDCSYDNKLSYVIVEDASGNELLPNKETAMECRKNWHDLPMEEDTSDYVDSITIPLSGDLSDLYVKE